MHQDFGRLKRLHGELAALRAICKSDFVLRSIDEVMAEISARLQALESIEHAGAVQYHHGDEVTPTMG